MMVRGQRARGEERVFLGEEGTDKVGVLATVSADGRNQDGFVAG